MVLESIIPEKKLRKHPVLIFVLTVIVCAGSILFARLLFPQHASVLSVAFITIGLVPLIYDILSDEEAEELAEKHSASTFFARHFNLIMLYVWIFIGIIFSFAVIYAGLPFFSSVVEFVSAPISPLFGFEPFKSCTTLGNCDSAKGLLFDEQLKAFCGIAGSCNNGVPLSIAGRASAFGLEACRSSSSTIVSCTWFIFENNAGVLLFTVVLSLLYGVGAVFIIVWNASILGVFFGENLLLGDHVKWIGMLQSMLVGHGAPELFGYVFGALAGAVLSALVARGELFTHDADVILKDVLFLCGLAFFSVAYGAITEAVGILKLTEAYFLLGFLYLLVVIVMVYLYSGTRAKPRLSW
jgi:hypothetical protein